MALHATFGATFYIGTTAPIDFTNYLTAINDFDDDEYTEVSWLVDMGEFGAESEVSVRRFINADYVERRKGTRDAGAMAIVVGRDPTDPGQRAMLAAEADTNHTPYNCKVVLNDRPTSDGEKTVYYFQAIIASARVVMGTEADQTNVSFNCAISGRIVPVMAGTAVEITPAAGALTAGEEGVPYTAAIAATGNAAGAISYIVTAGALPDGLSLNSSTGVISGTPMEAGTYNFTIGAIWGWDAAASAAYSLVIAP